MLKEILVSAFWFVMAAIAISALILYVVYTFVQAYYIEMPLWMPGVFWLVVGCFIFVGIKNSD